MGLFYFLFLVPTKSAYKKCYASDMGYIFYADVYFLQNTIIKISVLYLTLYVHKMLIQNEKRKLLLKLVGGTCLATALEIIFLMSNLRYSFLRVIFLVVELPCLLFFVVGRHQKHRLRLCITSYVYLGLTNSVVEVLWNWYGENTSFILLLILASCVMCICVRMYRNYARMQKGIFEVCFFHNGKIVQVKGLYDSGNSLKDPYTGYGVHIVKADLLEKLRINKTELVLVPYHALGNNTGMLEVYYIEKVIVEGEKGRIIIENCPVGVTKDNLFEEKKYEMILNEEVF